MKLYHKEFKNRSDMSVYLSNPEQLIAYDEELLNRLMHARNTDELHEAKCSILKDFRDIHTFDVIDAEFPEPAGHFDSEKDKKNFIRKKILLHDMVLYLGSVYRKYHTLIYEKNGALPEVEGQKLAINYNELYCKAMEDYMDAIKNSKLHAVAATFVLPSLIEQCFGVSLQDRMLIKCIVELNDKNLTEEEKKLIAPFIYNHNVLFFGSEKYIMGKVYELFTRKCVLKVSSDNEMILTGETQNGKRKRTLGSLLKTSFAKEEILPEYLELMDNFFGELNIRNCIMHGLGETFDYLNIGLTAIMFQLLWDVAACEIFTE